MALRRLLMALWGVALAAGSVWLGSPALADELSDKLVENGREVFLTAGGVGCASCHGRYGEGNVGPFNRGVSEVTVRGALQSADAMGFLRDSMTEEKITQVAAYLGWLGELQLVKTLVKQGRFIPDEVSVYPGTAIQLAVQNASLEAHAFAGDVMGVAPFRVNGRDFGDVTWKAPDTEGAFELRCTDCGSDGKLTIRVSRSAKRHVPPSKAGLSRPAATSAGDGEGS